MSDQCLLYPQKRTSLNVIAMSAKCQMRTHAAQQIPGLATIRLASRRAKERTVATAIVSTKPACDQQGVMLCAATPAMIATQSQPSGIQSASFRRMAYSGNRLLRFRAHGSDAPPLGNSHQKTASVLPTTATAVPGAKSCLRTDARSCRKLFHAFGDNVSQLHHLLIQFRVFGNVALNAIAIAQ